MRFLKLALSFVEILYAAVSVGVAFALILRLGPVADATNATSIRILGGAVLAIGIGAVAVAVDPVRNRVILPIQIVFTVSAGLALGWKYVTEHSERAKLILIPLLAFMVLLVIVTPGAWAKDRRKKEPVPFDRR